MFIKNDAINFEEPSDVSKYIVEKVIKAYFFIIFKLTGIYFNLFCIRNIYL